jgi:hypothetical protein
MNFFRRLFGRGDVPPPEQPHSGRPFGSTDGELNELLVSLGQAVIGSDEIIITGYPFKPSLAFGYKVIDHSEITNIDCTSWPPALLIKNELIFISAEHKEALKVFAEDNEVKQDALPDIWDWILTPFLDTEFTPEREQDLTERLARHGLDSAWVNLIRNEVGEQMYKYNFDTMLWDWWGLGLADVLRAMRPKYDDERFRIFYKQAMEIALLPPLNEENK